MSFKKKHTCTEVYLFIPVPTNQGWFWPQRTFANVWRHCPWLQWSGGIGTAHGIWWAEDCCQIFYDAQVNICDKKLSSSRCQQCWGWKLWFPTCILLIWDHVDGSKDFIQHDNSHKDSVSFFKVMWARLTYFKYQWLVSKIFLLKGK